MHFKTEEKEQTQTHMAEKKELNLYQKLAKIRRSVEVLEKDKAGYGYRYVTDALILSKITGLMDSLHVSLIPSVVPGTMTVTPYAYVKTKLNKKTGEIKLISFERGIMVEVPGVGTELLTHSFHYGGAELTTQLLRDYFLLDIAGYAHVDFDTFAQLVDAVGGVDIEISDAESYALGVKPGWNHLDGKTALYYCRLRSIDSNWHRIARQRTTVQAILNQVKDMNLSELSGLAETILPLIHTDLSKAEITSILLSAPKFLGATAQQMAVPDNNNQNCDFQYETDRLRAFIYG